METYFQGFHEDEVFSTDLLLSDIDEVMKDQLVGLESFKLEEIWREENNKSEISVDREDFQQIMSDWQQHLGSLHSNDNEDLGLGLDTNSDILNNYSNIDIFEEIESPILSKALKYPGKKHDINIQSLSKTLAPSVSKDSFLENFGDCNESYDSNEKLCGIMKTETNVIRKVSFINGEREILGKNIIGLHCLNEIQENPVENCQVTSTVINGKRYKIIIKPKSLRVKKLSEEKLRKSLIKKLTQCHIATKTELKEDQSISKVCIDNSNVPVPSCDLLPNWDLAALDFEWSKEGKNKISTAVEQPTVNSEKKVTPLKIKLSKLKKPKKLSVEMNEKICLKSVNNKVVEGHTLGTLLKNFEEEVAKLEEKNDETNDVKNNEGQYNLTAENIKSCLPKDMINKIEALKHQKQCRIPLIQAMPTKKTVKNGTRMQDAVATMNRNKLLKIVAAGDSVQLDHDYCSTFIKTNVTNRQLKKSVCLNVNLVEKNPKKDSGMESGDVSDASESPITPDCSQNLQVNNKTPEESCARNHPRITTAMVGFSQASDEVTINGNTNMSDSVKTKTVSNGNKVLTNDNKNLNCNSDNSSTDSSVFNVKNTNGNERRGVETETNKKNPIEQYLPLQSERPKKKLKLEEYLNRKHLKEKEQEKNNKCSDIEKTGSNIDMIKSVQNNDLDNSNGTEIYENIKEKFRENHCSHNRNKRKKENKNKKFRRSQNCRSSSVSSSERRRRSRSVSVSRWKKSSNNCSNGRLREEHEKQRCRRSESRERKSRKEFWSNSLSQSSSRESSTSSDRSVGKHCRNSSTRYRRRSRSRSVSQDTSTSRNLGCKKHCSSNYYYKKNFNCRRMDSQREALHDVIMLHYDKKVVWIPRKDTNHPELCDLESKSPFYAYSMREKQRQIEERRVIYVGRIEEGMTNAKLRERFSIFGPIIDISLHFREHGDNYGFVTYAYKADAYDAVEHGNDDPKLPHYDLCFGGRRGFCKEKYADLDGMPTSYSGFKDTLSTQNSKDSFDLLLKEAQAKLKNRKKQ